jgi:hypothetical protein
MAMLGSEDTRYPAPERRLRLGFVGGGRGALVGEWHAKGARLSNHWDIVAGALSSTPETAKGFSRRLDAGARPRLCRFPYHGGD